LNHPNFDQPVGNIDNAQFGYGVRTVSTPTSIFGSFLGADQIRAQLTFLAATSEHLPCGPLLHRAAFLSPHRLLPLAPSGPQISPWAHTSRGPEAHVNSGEFLESGWRVRHLNFDSSQ
jgi:hypothetical protein